MDTEISKQILQIGRKLLKNPNWREASLKVGHLQSVKELNLGPPNTNPSSGREEDFNPGVSGLKNQCPDH